MFQKDFEALKSAGAARNDAELEIAANEYENLMGVERGFRRGTLHIRTTGGRIGEALERYLPLVSKVVEEENPQLPVKVVPMDNREGHALIIRRVRKIRDEIIQGHPLEPALVESGLSMAELRQHLETHSAGRPDLVWLEGYLTQIDQLKQLKDENQRLTRVAADLSARLLGLEKKPAID